MPALKATPALRSRVLSLPKDHLTSTGKRGQEVTSNSARADILAFAVPVGTAKFSVYSASRGLACCPAAYSSP